MTDQTRQPDDGDSHQDIHEDISAQDQLALTELFAALTADAPPSEVSPLRVVKLARTEVDAGVDRRVRRFRILRNVAVAAAVATVAVLVGPKVFGPTSSSTTASEVGGSEMAAARAAASNGAAASSAAAVSGVAAAGSAAAVSSAAASGAASSAGSLAGPIATGSSASAAAAPTPAASVPDSLSSPAAASGRASASGSTGTGRPCGVLSGRSAAAVNQALAANSLTSAGVTDCATGLDPKRVATGGTYGVAQTGRVVRVNVRAAALGACGRDQPALCHPVAGTPGVYRTTSGPLAVWVYGGGKEVYLQSDAAEVTVKQLETAGRAVLKALG